MNGLLAAHDLAATEDENIIGNEESGASRKSAEKRLAGLEAEIFGVEAHDSVKGFREDGPKGEAEGAVEGWEANFEP